MRATWAVAVSVLREAARRKIFYGVVLVGIILILLVPALPSSGVGVQVQLLRQACLGLSALMGALLAVILGCSILPGEFERRTIYNALSKPIRRSNYYLGKFLGLAITLLIALAVLFFIVFFLVLGKFGIFNPGLLKAFLGIYLESLVLAAVALLASVYLTAVPAFFVGVLFYVACHVKADFLYRTMTDAANVFPLRALAGVFYYILPNLERFNLNETIAHSEEVFQVGAGTIGFILGLAAIFGIAFLAIGMGLFQRKEF